MLLTERLRVVIYIRVSDISQLDNNSLETQLKACLQFAEANNYEVVKIFREEGVSAKHVQTRPQMRELLEFCTLKKNKVSAVLVYKIDRWSRNVEEGLIAISLLAKYGVSLIPTTEVAEQNPMGKAMRTILMALGELDNNLKGERVRDNMQTNFKKGLWCWKPRIGYKRPFKTKEENRGKPPVIDGQLGEIVRSLFIKASEMRTSKKHLADYINGLGFGELYGSKADGRLVARIIKDSFYYGYMYAPKWKEYAWGRHEPLTDELTWEKANINVLGIKRKYNIQDSKIYPLKGVLLCKSCEHPMTSSNPMGTGKHYLYYECHNKPCTNHERIGIDIAHRIFTDLLDLMKPSERVLKLFTHMVFSEWEETIKQTNSEAELRERQIKILQDKLTSLAESNAKHILTDDEARESAEKIRRDMAILKVERSEIRIEQYDTEAVMQFTENFLVHLDKLWLHMDLPQKQALQNEVFPRGLMVEDGKIRTVNLARTFELIGEMSDVNFNFVTPREVESRSAE